MLISSKALHPLNVYAPKADTPSLIVTLLNLVQRANVLLPILFTLSGIVRCVKPLHPENAFIPIISRLSESFISVKSLQ